MRKSCFVILFSLLLLTAGCANMAVRSTGGHYLGQMDFDTDLRKGEVDTVHSYRRLEVAFEVDSMEWFLDGGSYRISDESDERLDADGYGIGFGGRTLPPRKAGWGPDAGFRLGFHELDFTERATGVARDWDYEGFDAEINAGAYHAFELPGDLLFSFHGGAYLREVSETLNTTGWLVLAATRFLSGTEGSGGDGTSDGGSAGDGESDGDDESIYSLVSLGIYAGARLNFASNDWFDLSANAFVGTDEVAGFSLSGAFRF